MGLDTSFRVHRARLLASERTQVWNNVRESLTTGFDAGDHIYRWHRGAVEFAFWHQNSYYGADERRCH